MSPLHVLPILAAMVITVAAIFYVLWGYDE
jgi:hypothetical protein